MLGQNAQFVTQSGFAGQVATYGSDTAPYVRLIAEDFSALSGADIADIAHFLCILHGRHPGVIDHAATKTADDAAREWLLQATDGFAAERAFLTKLTVAAGPISGVSADDQSNAAATPALERALNFGREQLLNQHRGLWQLLEARRNMRLSR